MNGSEYADSIRLDKPKPQSEIEQVKALRRQVILLSYKNVPLWGVYIIFTFYMITQYFILSRPNPPNMFIDILTMVALVAHTYAYTRFLRRYLILEIKYFQNEIKKMEQEVQNEKNTRR